MQSDIETIKAQIMWKLVRKGNWGHCYDRLEHFKRFPMLDKAIKELVKQEWIIIHKKSRFKAISLNPKYKYEIIKFIEDKMKYIKES